MSLLLQSFLDTLKQGEILSPFVILYGPGVDKEWENVRESSREAVGFFAEQDILDIRDYSTELGKQHTLKVEKSNNKEDRDLLKDHQYDNRGSREINHRLSLAPSGDLKIVLLEHLGRANTSAANALLKNLEEPLSGRIIVASLKNKDAILETILSRALLIYCGAEYEAPVLSETQKSEFDAVLEAFSTQDLGTLTKAAANIKKERRERAFLYGLMYHMNTQGDYDSLMWTVEAYRKLSANVLSEHVLFQLFIKVMNTHAN